MACMSVVAVSIAACSSSSSGDGNSTSGGGDINLTAIGLFQSPAISLPDSKAGFIAAADAINAAGGINGHKIKLTTCDDQFDPNTAAKCARQAVSNKAVAVVTSYTTYPDQMLPILQAAGIPYLYGTVLDPTSGSSPIVYPLDAGSAGGYFATGLQAVKDGCSKVGAVVVSNPNTTYGAKWLRKGVEQAGGQLVQTSVGTTQADFSAPVAKLVSQGVGCVVPVTAPDQGVKVVEATRQQAPKVSIKAIGTEFGTAQLDALGSKADGIVMTDQTYRVTDTEEPGVKAVIADFKKYQPDVAMTDAFSIRSWSSVDAFAQLVKTIKGAITKQSVSAAAKTFAPKLETFGPSTTGAPLSNDLPRVRNWSYLVWTVKDGKAVLNSPKFITPTAV